MFARGNRQRHARLLCDQLPFVRSLIVCAIRDDRAVVFGQLHDVAVFGLMVDVMRGKARRWSESVISRELKCGRGELKLFDAIPAMAQKGEHAVGAAHMSRTGDNEEVFPLRRYPSIFGIRHRCPAIVKQRQPHSTFACISHGLIVARNKGKRAIDKREQPL